MTMKFTLVVLLAAGASTVHAAAPNSCAFLTPAAVSGAVGRPVTGGVVSIVNDPSSSTSNCMYRAGELIISLSVNQLPSAAAARAEFNDELDNSRSRDERDPAQQTALIPGLGDGAFYAIDGPAIAMTGVSGNLVITIALLGPGAGAVPQEHLHSLLQAALSHR
jgi:hypothetical protein